MFLNEVCLVNYSKPPDSRMEEFCRLPDPSGIIRLRGEKQFTQEDWEFIIMGFRTEKLDESFSIIIERFN